MGQQQQQQPVQHLRPGIDPAKIMATPVPIHRNSFSMGDVSGPTAVKRQASSSPHIPALNFWRELTPEDFVIGYARGLGRVRCSTCLSKITQGQLQVRHRRRGRSQQCTVPTFLPRTYNTPCFLPYPPTSAGQHPHRNTCIGLGIIYQYHQHMSVLEGRHSIEHKWQLQLLLYTSCSSSGGCAIACWLSTPFRSQPSRCPSIHMRFFLPHCWQLIIPCFSPGRRR